MAMCRSEHGLSQSKKILLRALNIVYNYYCWLFIAGLERCGGIKHRGAEDEEYGHFSKK
jgi:hypothetical protein